MKIEAHNRIIRTALTAGSYADLKEDYPELALLVYALFEIEAREMKKAGEKLPSGTEHGSINVWCRTLWPEIQKALKVNDSQLGSYSAKLDIDQMSRFDQSKQARVLNRDAPYLRNGKALKDLGAFGKKLEKAVTESVWGGD